MRETGLMPNRRYWFAVVLVALLGSGLQARVNETLEQCTASHSQLAGSRATAQGDLLLFTAPSADQDKLTITVAFKATKGDAGGIKIGKIMPVPGAEGSFVVNQCLVVRYSLPPNTAFSPELRRKLLLEESGGDPWRVETKPSFWATCTGVTRGAYYTCPTKHLYAHEDGGNLLMGTNEGLQLYYIPLRPKRQERPDNTVWIK